jgi:GT2 family glycosyltransferase
VPDLPRPDVADRAGLGEMPRVGFHLALDRPGPGPAVLVLEPPAGRPGQATVQLLPGTVAPRGTGGLRPPWWMPRRLAGLFQRFAAHHLDCAGPGPTLRDPKGATLGHVDAVRLTGSRLVVEGWANARRVVLQAGAMRRAIEPQLPRTDVAEALDLPAELGFYIDLPRPDFAAHEIPILLVEPRAGGAVAAPLPLPGTGAVRRRLLRSFLWRLLRLSPALVQWRLTRDARHRATIKAVLGLNGHPGAEALDPGLWKPPEAAEEPPAAPDRPVTIILPVYNAFDLLPEVLDRVLRHTDLPFRLLVIEDCSPDPQVRPFLQDWVAAEARDHPGRVELLLNDTNQGFIGSVNRGLAAARRAGGPVVLLNSDAFVPEGWASRLLRPILEDDSVASVTPMSNDAEIFSVPAICARTVLEPGMADAIDAVAQGFPPGPAARAEAPTGVGFCMAINPAFLERVPQLDTAFGRGYGEEVDWCQKARAAGGRHLGIADLFVEHRGGESFGSEEKLKLVAANNARIARRYPRYDAEVQAHIAADPMITPRLALAVAWMAAWAARAPGRRVPVYLAHSMGGGAEHYLQKRIDDGLKADGRPALVLRVGGNRRWRLEAVSNQGRTIGESDDFGVIRRLLAPLGPCDIVYSCGVGDPDPAELPGRLLELAADKDARIEVLLHDFFPLSPSYTLLDGDGVYRGPLAEAAARAGDRAHQSRRADGTLLDLAGWQAEWGRLLRAAAKIEVFSEDSRRQLCAALPDLNGTIAVVPHRLPVTPPALPRPGGGRRVFAVLGNIGYQKGAAVLQDLAGRLAGEAAQAGSGPKPGLVVLGNLDPAYALPADVPVHGSYRVEDLPELAARYGVTDWLIPSIWPETFSYTTHEALATGLPVWAFDIGAQGDAVRGAPNGVAVPLGPGDDPAARLWQAIGRA